MIGIKCELQEQLCYKSFIEMYISKLTSVHQYAAILIVNCLGVTSSIHILHLQLIIYKLYANHIS